MHRRAFLALTGAVLLSLSPAAGVGIPDTAEFIGGVVWRGSGPDFGGFSAIEVDEAGKAFIAVTDRGGIVTGEIVRGPGSRIVGLEAGPVRPLRDVKGITLKRPDNDAEGIAVTADGTIFISFEGNHRVEARSAPTAPSRILPRHPDFEAFPGNGGLEALAIDADNTLYAVPEDFRRADGTIPVYVFRDQSWTQPYAIRAEGRFLPVGADIGPDGRFYLLERDFRGIFGFRSRIRRFSLPGNGHGFGAGEVLLDTRAGRHDNLEGISVWRDGNEAIRITMISDDNFFPAQRTEIVEYRVREGLAADPAGR